jgi:hypothetical protein
MKTPPRFVAASPILIAMRGWLPLAALTTLAACTHERTLSLATHASMPLQRSSTRKVAIVLEDRLVSPRYETSTDGHNFVLYGAPRAIAQALESALAGRVALVHSVRAPAPTGFDAYVFPALSLEASGLVKHHCTARLAVEVRDAAGQTVGRGHGEADEVFYIMFSGTEACETALAAALGDAATQALPGIDALP